MTVTLAKSEMDRLGVVVGSGGWELDDVPHALWRGRKEGVVVTAYKSGKVTIQGKGAEDFVEFVLEPLVTGVPTGVSGVSGSGSDASVGEVSCSPAALPWPHAGIDESGKGDYFGPLVVAAVYVESSEVAERLEGVGVKDSKLIKSDAKIAEVSVGVRRAVGGKFAIVSVGPEAYNRLYGSIGNLNKLLAWGHARALENLLERAPECGVALSDKFGASSLIENALMEKGSEVELHQRVRGESDLAVAAASILARDGFVKGLSALGEELGVDLPKGASGKVDAVASSIALDFGVGKLLEVAKYHFKTTVKALSAAGIAPEGESR
jgi:ribonuclease HIII